MQISPDQGAFMTLLTRLVGARFAVEVGTFTGYSSICIARGLADGGRLLCCDVSEEWTAIAKEHWEKAGVADRIELRIGPAADTLRELSPDPPIDLAFIDADKPGYRTYYDEIVPRLRAGGLLLLDNVLWSGNVVDAGDDSENTQAIRAINDHVAADDRVEAVMLPIADGLTICRKR
jgi:caffeoyl-CoA O-methyltransferase